ncbi:capsular polysaccharide synthesis protein [Butyrivibrio sp. AE3004]|uniref:capsular polysaccharide synthesis protein n=1 Tax=Butyrivibrio sp. AE3004 TaxID=1506994 RepID=UPI000494990A|nr:capsular polysaccharide synthesis protein [Butyrivibrio sp. AE3004]
MVKSDNKLINRIKDGMLLGTIYDQVMLKVKYNDEKTHFLYSVMVGQKHRMILYKRYKNKYLNQCIQERIWEKKEKKQNSNTVWIMWLQGLNNAPDIVKKCVESQKKAMAQKKFIIIDENNIYDYVTLPDYIIQKREKGIITNAMFSDLVRLELLNKYGGYWIDASVFMTDGELISEIDNLPLFMFSFYYFGFNPEIMEYNSWFMHSTSNNNLLCLLQQLMYAYWKEHNYISNYYLLHILGSIANDYYKEECEAMPIISQVDAHILATYIYDNYDPYKYKMLTRKTGIHKLSIKFDQERLRRKGTFYDVIINQGNF